MNAAEERDYLEQVIAGKAQPTLSPAGTLGRLAQLYLEVPQGPGSPARALQLVQAGLNLVKTGSPLYPKFRHFEAMALRALSHPPPDALGTHGAAAQADREAFQLSLKSNPFDALAFAQSWADWAWSRDLFAEAGEAYSNAHRAQTQLVLSEIDQDARMKLQGSATFATRGAYALNKTGEVQQAILLLEQTCLASLNATKQRSDLVRLEKVNPQLKAALMAALQSMLEIHQHSGPDAFGGLSPEEQQARAQRDAIVGQIRQIPGFESFATRAGWDDVAEASAQNALVYLVPTGKGTLAIAVAPGKDAKRRVGALEISVSIADLGGSFVAFAKAEGGDGDRQAALFALLEWLWSNVMAHVKALLSEVLPQPGPFTLIPFGLYANLPIHLDMTDAAESATPASFHPQPVTFDYSGAGAVTSQRRSLRQNAAASVLVINNPRPIPPEYDELLLSDFEARMVQGHFQCETLTGHDADAKSVLELLPQAALAHFSCHGNVSAAAGYSGVLVLANSALSYEHLRMLPELTARLVVLSACRAGASALEIEYGVNLPNAFLSAGAAAVLGTLWHTDELASLLLLTRFYELWLDPQTPRTPVQALVQAQVWLMTSPAQTLRAAIPPDVLQSPAAGALQQAAGGDFVYAHPWYWGGFFIAGA